MREEALHTMSDWKKRMSFLTPQFEAVKIGNEEQEFRFYPVTVGFVFKLSRLGEALSRSLSKFFVAKNNDVKVTEKTATDKEGNCVREVTNEGITVELAKYRDEQAGGATADLIKALADESNRAVIGEIIMDSLQEDFPRDEKGNHAKGSPTGLEFINAIPLTRLPLFLRGLAVANKDALGPLGRKASLFQKLAAAKVEDVINSLGEESPKQAASN